MMDATVEIPQPLVATSKTVCADGRTRERRSPPSMVATVSKVLDDDNLLIEILLRIGFPTTLICAALVCKHWYHHASDHEFLNQFRKRHPPRLLGFYFQDMEVPGMPAHFFPVLPQPPELATVIRHASFKLESYGSPLTEVLGCWNGSVLLYFPNGSEFAFGVHFPLRPERGLNMAPLFPRVQDLEGYFYSLNDFLSVQEADGLSCLELFLRYNKERTILMLHAYMLRHCDGVWRTDHTMATYKHQLPDLQWSPNGVLVDNKIYMPSDSSAIVVLDLMASRISTIQLPKGVEKGDRDTMFARPDDASGVYLIHAKKLQLHIWQLKEDTWSLVDTICLRQMFANLMISDCTAEDEHVSLVHINHVGDNAEFAVLQRGRCVFYLDIKCRTLRKVHEMTETDPTLGDIHPFMMIWPPTFPALKDAAARNAM
ncbi:hypothetical protein ACQ4PT_038002 [Festuca glaucescens]